MYSHHVTFSVNQNRNPRAQCSWGRDPCQSSSARVLPKHRYWPPDAEAQSRGHYLVGSLHERATVSWVGNNTIRVAGLCPSVTAKMLEAVFVTAKSVTAQDAPKRDAPKVFHVQYRIKNHAVSALNEVLASL